MINQAVKQKKTILISYITGGLLLLVGFFLSLIMGTVEISVGEVISSFFEYNDSVHHLVIQELRLPRTLTGIIIGASLALAGAVMQSVTRNPLASPEVYGISGGATVAVVLIILYVPIFVPSNIYIFSFIGAALAGFLIYAIGAFTRPSPVMHVLVGMGLYLLLIVVCFGLILQEKQSFLLMWINGMLTGSSWGNVKQLFLCFLLGTALLVLLSRFIGILGARVEHAQGASRKVMLVRLLPVVIVVIFVGSSVASAGPIGFIGLIIPNMVRKVTGNSFRTLHLLSALFGASFLLFADILARKVYQLLEYPVGRITMIIGIPIFLYLVGRAWYAKKNGQTFTL